METKAFRHDLSYPDYTAPALKRDYPEWHRNRGDYYLIGIVMENREIARYVNTIKRQFSSYLVMPYERQPHITLRVLGFMQPEPVDEDEFNGDHLDRIHTYFTKSSLPSFDIVIGQINTFQGALYLEVDLPSRVQEQCRHGFEFMTSEMRDIPFRAHVTVGLYNDYYPLAEIHEKIGKCNLVQEIVHNVKSITLLSYAPGDIGSKLKHVKTYPLKMACANQV